MTKSEFNNEVNSFNTFVNKIANDTFEDMSSVESTGLALCEPNEESEGQFRIAALMLPPQMFGSDEGKAMIGDAIREANDDLKPMAIAIITEGWMVEVDADDKEAVKDFMEGKRKPSTEKNKEVVTVNVETHAANGITMYEIDRSGEKPTLKLYRELTWITKEPNQPVGKLQNLIPKQYVDIIEDTVLN